jgi:pimeloyl-ACP methyl ester carboxylesterase
MIRTPFYLHLGAVVFALHAVTASAGALLSGEPASFVFTDPGYFRDKPVTVYYYKAKAAGAEAKVVIAIHGAERSGQLARDTWMELAEKYGLIVLAPEFDLTRFPEKLFQFGGITETDPARWTFPVVEHIFEQVRRDNGLQNPSYILFGHSAGAQFVHRFVLSMDRSHVSAAVAANAGTYTMPEYSRSIFATGFPWTLDERRVDNTRLRAAFGQRMIVLLGEKDVTTGGPDVPRSNEALAQGAHRLERGQKFFAVAKAQAERLGTELKWELVVVPGVGHSSRAMSRVAARMLLEGASP